MLFLRRRVFLHLTLLIIQLSCFFSFNERRTLRRKSWVPSFFQRKISRIAFNPSSIDNILNTPEEIAKSFLLSKKARERSHKLKSLSNTNFQFHLLIFTLLMLPMKIIHEINSFKIKIVALITSAFVIGLRRKEIINRFKEFRMKMLAQSIVEETIKVNESFIPAYDSTINSFNDDVRVYEFPDVDQNNGNNLMFSSIFEDSSIISPEPSSPDSSSNILTSTGDIQIQSVSKDSSLHQTSNYMKTYVEENHSDADDVTNFVEQESHDETTRNRVVMQMLTGALAGTVVGGPVGGVVATAVTATIIYEKEKKLKEQQNLEQSNTNEQEEQAYS